MKRQYRAYLRILSSLFFSTVLVQVISSQNKPSSIAERFPDIHAKILEQTDTAGLLDKAAKWNLQFGQERVAAIAFALANGFPIERQNNHGGSFVLIGFDGSGQLAYDKTDNLNAAKTLSTNEVWSGGGAGLSLSGADWNIGVWDGGAVLSTHQELSGRVFQIDSPSALSDHATHVSGTLGAMGVNSNAKGMASEISIVAHDLANDLSEMAYAHGQNWVSLSNHSYGSISGWDYGDYGNGEGWYWWGNTGISSQEDYKFGIYNDRARDFDELAYEAPYYLIVKSAGNDRNDEHSGPHFVRNSSSSWVSSTSFRQADGGSNGYDCISTYGCAKNILTVGAIHDLPNGYTSPSGVNMSSFSGWGPTDDGRIKPDIVGNGVGLWSPIASANNQYDSFDGTSMSSPNVTGSIALLREHGYEVYEYLFPAAMLKALVLHTADDAGNPGPDYKFGWGVMNTRKAADHISEGVELDESKYLFQNLVENGDEISYRVFNDGTEPLWVTMTWTDPPGTASSPALNPTSIKLVNDLDLQLVHYLTSSEHQPWRMNPSNPSASATKGDNFRDNVEQVYISDPDPGWYQITISHKGSLSGGEQWFGMAITGGYRYSCNGFAEIVDCEGEIEDGSGSVNHYGNYSECTWRISPPGANSVTLSFTEFQVEEGFDFVDVFDGTSANAPLIGTFSGNIVPLPLTAISGSMFIRFTSDESITEPGWKANFSCDACDTPSSPWIIADDTEICQGQTTSITASGCSNCQVMWNNGMSTNTIIVNQGGNYSVYFINNCGEAGPSNSIDIDEISISAPTISSNGTTNPCQGEPVTLTATNVCPGCTVVWSPGGMTGTNITVSDDGTYSAIAIHPDCGNSPSSDPISIAFTTEIQAPTISPIGNTNPCQGESVTLNATNVCTDCTVVWTPGNMTGTSITVFNEGNYKATAIHPNCGSSDESNQIFISHIFAPQAPNIEVIGSSEPCAGSLTQLSATNVCSGCTVTWSPGNLIGLSVFVQPGTYTATVTNFANPPACQVSPSSNEITITENALPNTATVVALGSTELCQGETVTLMAQGVCPGCTVTWSPGGTTGTSLTANQTGNYSVTINNQCGSSGPSNEVLVQVYNIPEQPQLPSDPIILCPGENVTVVALNVCPGCTVTWSPGGMTAPTINISSAGNYSVIVTNPDNPLDCQVSMPSNILEVNEIGTLSTLVVSPSGEITLCNNESVTLTATGICPGCTVLWSNGMTGANIIVSEEDTYTASAVLANCGISMPSNPAIVTTLNSPNTSPDVQPQDLANFCEGQTAQLNISNSNDCPGCSVVWSNGDQGFELTTNIEDQYSAAFENECGPGPSSNEVQVVEIEFIPEIEVNNQCYLAAPIGTDFQWMLNGVPIEGANTQFFYVEETGYYTVSMINNDECAGISAPLFVEACTNAASEVYRDMKLSIWPNPTNKEINISFEILAPEKLKVELLPATGQRFIQLEEKHYTVGIHQFSLSVEKFIPGIYFLKLSGEKGVAVERLIVVE